MPPGLCLTLPYFINESDLTCVTSACHNFFTGGPVSEQQGAKCWKPGPQKRNLEGAGQIGISLALPHLALINHPNITSPKHFSSNQESLLNTVTTLSFYSLETLFPLVYGSSNNYTLDTWAFDGRFISWCLRLPDLCSLLCWRLSHLTAVRPWLITLLAWDPVSTPTLTPSLTLCPPIPSP